jgi:hypothetical protein
VRGAATLYMTMTGVLSGVLLAGYVEELGTAVARPTRSCTGSSGS